MSAARHAHESDAVPIAERDRGDRNPPAIVNVVLAVAAATIWLVALPAARDEPSAHRSCAAILALDESVVCGGAASSLTPAAP